MNMSKTVHSICALTDPFCDHAYGAKTPDTLSTRTLAYRLTGRATLATGAGGAGAILVVPGYNTFYAVGDATTTPGVAVYGAAAPVGTSLLPAGYRIVSFGVRIRNLLAPINSSGIIRVRGYTQNTGTSLTATSTSNYNCDFHDDLSMSNFTHMDIVGKRLDLTSNLIVAPATTHPTGNVVNWVAPGWGAFQIVLEGGPASASSLDLEFVINYELTFEDSDSLNLITTPPPAQNTALTQAADTVSKSAGNIFHRGIETVARVIEQKAISYISKFATSRAASALPLLLV